MSVKDVRSKGIPIELGGKTRYLKFDLNAFANLEEMYGDIEQAMNALEKGSIKAIRAILWAGLTHEFLDENGNTTLTEREVGGWFDITDLSALSGTIGEAFKDAIPEAGDEDQPVPFEQEQKKASK